MQAAFDAPTGPRDGEEPPGVGPPGGQAGDQAVHRHGFFASGLDAGAFQPGDLPRAGPAEVGHGLGGHRDPADLDATVVGVDGLGRPRVAEGEGDLAMQRRLVALRGEEPIPSVFNDATRCLAPGEDRVAGDDRALQGDVLRQLDGGDDLVAVGRNR